MAEPSTIVWDERGGHKDAPRRERIMVLLAFLCILLLTALLTGEAASFTLATVSLNSLLGLSYLAIVGSLVAYSAYFWLLRRCPPSLVATHTYVNPIVALILGWAVAGEVLSGRTLLSGAAVICAIALLSRGSSLEARGEHDGQQPGTCDASGLERRTV